LDIPGSNSKQLLFTFQIHPSLKAFSEAASRTVLPADLVDDAVVPARTQIVVLPCLGEREEEERENKGGKEREIAKMV
jgi:hypothetical protein